MNISTRFFRAAINWNRRARSSAWRCGCGPKRSTNTFIRACAELTFASCHRYIIGRLAPEKLNEFLESTPPISVTANWHARKKEIVRQGMAAPRVDRTFRLYDSYLQKMEDTLAEQAWLAGDTLSLADIAMAPYVNRLDMLGMSEMWVGSRRRLTEWFERMKSRPSFKPSLARHVSA